MSSINETQVQSDAENFALIGINSGACPPLIRSTIFSNGTDLVEILTPLNSKKNQNVYGVLTCDRMEIYFEKPFANSVKMDFFGVLGASAKVDPLDLEKIAYELSGEAALEHLFRMVSAMDSQVIGEPQILGQVRSCEKLSRTIAPKSYFLESIFQYAYSVAKRVKTETKISEGPTSLAAAAIRVARNISGDLTKCNGAIFGLDEIAIFLAKQFEQAGTKQFIYADSKKIKPKISQNLETDAHLQLQAQILAGSDIALICNNNSSYTVTEKLVRLALKLRKYKPLFIIDLGAPEAVEPTVENFDSAFIYNLENLEQLAVEGIEKRLLEKQKAERIISEELSSFCLKFPEPDIGAFASEIRDALEDEVQSMLKQRPNLDAKDASYLLLRKFLHQPLKIIRDLSRTNQLDPKTENLIRDLLIPQDIDRGDSK